MPKHLTAELSADSPVSCFRSPRYLQIDRHPITLNGTSNVSTKVKKNAKNEPKTEWGLIDTEVGLVVHVMTAAARARWSIEGIWSGSEEESAF